MSANIPESIPTSSDRHSKRAVKKRALTPVSQQAATVESLFARPDQEIRLPEPSGSAAVARRAVPEIVTNVQGSSAGAGSGEFHVYKASRRREYERLRRMDEEVRRETEAEEFERLRREREERDAERTRRNREKREKKMKSRGKGGGGGAALAKGKAGGHAKNGDGEAAKIQPRVSQVGGKDDVAMRDGEDGAQNGGQGTAATDQPGLVIHDDD